MCTQNRRQFVFAALGALLLGFTGIRAMAGEVKVEKDVLYGTVDATKLFLDAYTPDDAAGKHPGIVLIHGGGFIGGDKGFYTPMAKHLASKGYVVFSLNYRLAPKNRYPAAVDDVQRAVRWLRAHADTYHLDPDHIGALGDSAGGYLVTMLGTRETRDNSAAELSKFSSKVQCVVDLYGPSDFTIPASASGVGPQGIFLLTQFFGKPPEQALDLYKDGSPIVYVAKDSAPFLIVHGTTDPLVPVDQSRRLHDALKMAGVPVTLIELYKYNHGFLNPANPGQTGLLADDFLDRNLKGAPIGVNAP
ncbi:MAG: Esterase/lipase [Chthonomonadaceae bacterium]|nr:Esterase/lipase [Chthonomonadaceae bacterium]